MINNYSNVTKTSNTESVAKSYSNYSIGRMIGVNKLASTPTSALSSYASNKTNKSMASLMNFDFSSAFDKSSNLFMKNMKNSLSDVKSAASEFSKSGASNMFNQSLQTSDSSVVTGQAAMMSKLGSNYDVKVNQIAKSQTDSSESFSSNASSQIGSGSFNIEVGGKSSTISYTSQAGDTNKKTLSKIADSINKSTAGVSASVVTKDNKSSLQITSNQTGTNSAFTMTDNSGSDTASSLNMSNTAQAQNADYSVNGKDYTSQSNTVQIGATASRMTIKGEGEAKLTKQSDSSSILQAATDFAQSYNSVIDTLSTKSNAGTGVQRTESLMSSGLGSTRNLAKMGITKGQDGKLSIDQEKFRKAVSEDPSGTRDALTSAAKGVGRNADIASRIPQSTFTNITKMSYSTMNNALLTSGLLFSFGA